MDKILITGGAGFIGSNLAKALSQNNEIIIIDDLSMGNLKNLESLSNLKVIEGSILDKELMQKILTQHQFTYVFHLAAIASVADSVARPVQTHQVNFEGTLQLLELCRLHQPDLKRFVFASSAAVYGDEPALPKTELSSIKPLSPYAIDKYASEQFALNYYHLYQVPCTAVRFFNVYGPNQNPSSPYSGVISILLDRYKKLLNQRESSFTLFGDGSQSRDFVFVEDVVSALQLVATNETALGNVYNVGSGKPTSLLELKQMFDINLQVDLPIEYKEQRTGDIPHSLASIERLQELGYAPRFSLAEGIKKYTQIELLGE